MYYMLHIFTSSSGSLPRGGGLSKSATRLMTCTFAIADLNVGAILMAFAEKGTAVYYI